MRKMYKTRLFITLLLCVSLALALAGCHPQREQTNPAETNQQTGTAAESGSQTGEEKEPLLIFACQELDTAMSNFTSAYPDIPVKVVFDTYGMEIMIEKFGDPDIIIDSEWENLGKWVKEGYIEDLTGYYFQDKEMDSNQYYPGTLEAGEVDGTLYALPLSIEIPFMTVREAAWTDSALEMLPENYTGLDVLRAMEVELDKPREEGIWVFSGGFESPLEFLNQLGAIKKENDRYEIDQEVFEQAYRVAKKEVLNWTQMYKTIKGGLFDTAAIDPREENCLAAVYGGIAPQVDLLYAQCATAQLLQQDIHVVWMPTLEEGGQYRTEVVSFGVVCSKAKQKQAAYDALRKMMDMPVQVWTSPGNWIPKTKCPINRVRAKELMNFVERQGKDEFTPIGNRMIPSIQKQPLNDELRAELEYVLDHINMVYRYDEKMNKVLQLVYDNIWYGETDAAECYRMVMEVLNGKVE